MRHSGVLRQLFFIAHTLHAFRVPAWDNEPLQPVTSGHVTIQPPANLSENYSIPVPVVANLTVNKSASVVTNCSHVALQRWNQVVCSDILRLYERCLTLMSGGTSSPSCDQTTPHKAFQKVCMAELEENSASNSGITQWGSSPKASKEEEEAEAKAQRKQCGKFEKMYAQAVAEGNFVVRHSKPQNFLGQVENFDVDLFCKVVSDLNFETYSTAGMTARLPGDA
eukprot:gnl/MRDRNA2_/MRDRNA2_100511_c0_seq1.p1 gnl/MRDRNA2_/MRDRNA2_100511_c0~~gnl/MRDRNA2_/MRDRNA2_100511_c0_seq1.p1  ORF type:complete len:224 (+),score=31.17 gnl/MRDRNA2_/MRDRNA2_100511_c0_seq1:74-745(+)